MNGVDPVGPVKPIVKVPRKRKPLVFTLRCEGHRGEVMGAAMKHKLQ